ncbi:hypothetical protein JSO54_07915 [Riemerella anatipestifer]|uniref:hypothetical protein n=1 Tax=Riemerella anatipestifer TaxID=34085 RepID=UPI00137512EC|nr:hypothetical protein [Riemerella anatipestifer]
MRKEHILLLIPRDYNLYELIERALESMGYRVTVVHNEYQFRYKSLRQRLYNAFRKTVYKDKIFKRTLVEIHNLSRQEELINIGSEFYDFCLVFRADFFLPNVLLQAKTKSRNMVAYQYDGLKRSPSVFDLIQYFDAFYVFDSSDVETYSQYGLRKATNFYFKDDNINSDVETFDNDFYFLGSFHKSRLEILNKLSSFFRLNGIKFDFNIVFQKEKRRYIKRHENINVLYEMLPFSEYLNKVAKSKFILDILIEEHQGLSFRIFEALYLRKKVVTTNQTVKDYDFYHPDNFFIIGDRNLEELIPFLKGEYVDLDETIIEKYSFESWFNNIKSNI